jgi:hypothetical protein
VKLYHQKKKKKERKKAILTPYLIWPCSPTQPHLVALKPLPSPLHWAPLMLASVIPPSDQDFSCLRTFALASLCSWNAFLQFTSKLTLSYPSGLRSNASSLEKPSLTILLYYQTLSPQPKVSLSSPRIFFFIYSFAVLGIELRALHLLH